MKLRLAIGLFILVFQLHGQEKEITNIVKTNPIFSFVGHYTLRFEKLIAPKHSLSLEGSYTNNFKTFVIGGFRADGYGTGLGYRYYFKEKNMEGWFVSPRIRYHYFKTNILAVTEGEQKTFFGDVFDTTGKNSKTALTRFDVLIGYQTISRMFSYELFLGPSLINNATDYHEDSRGVQKVTFLSFTLGLSLGLGF